MAERVEVPERNTTLSATPALSWAVTILPVVGCSLMMVLSAQVRVPVPLSDVPMTLQLLAVLLTGFALSPGRAASAMLLYLAYGAAGLPVFAGVGGLFGPTGGYLLGFVVAAWSVSTLSGRGLTGPGRLVLAGLAGTAVLFAVGIAWRVLLCQALGLFGGDAQFAVVAGTMPFIAKALVELCLAVTMVTSARGVRSWLAARSWRNG